MDQNIFQTVYKVNHAGGSGSCFYLKKHDLFVTNYHVVEGFRQVALEDNQKNRYLANIVLVNPILDIALLSAEGDRVFGRNYDFSSTNTAIVYTNPGKGRHASSST